MSCPTRKSAGIRPEARPWLCEEETIKCILVLAERTKCPLHLMHTSAAVGAVLAAGRACCIDVTVGTYPYHLTRSCYTGFRCWRRNGPVLLPHEKRGL